MMPSSLDEDELDRLFRLPLSEFVKARNDLAGTLKKGKDAEAARAVKEIVKPSVSAWAVNQLYWRERAAFDELVSAGDRYRAAQQNALSAQEGVSLAAAERERNAAIESARRSIEALLESEGMATSATLLRRITTTLEAIASYGSANPRPLRGRLTDDLHSPGFAALSTLAPAVPPPRPRLVPAAVETPPRLPTKPAPPSPDAEELARARERREEARAAIERARSAFVAASSRAERARAEVERARAHLVEAEREENRLRADRERARESMLDAERRLEELGTGVSPGKR